MTLTTTYTVTPVEYLRMLDDVKLQGNRTPQSVIVRALTDTRMEIRNVAIILASRRGIQVVTS